MLDTFKKATPEALAAIQAELTIRSMRQFFLLFVRGSHFDHLIMQKAAKRGVYMIAANPATVTANDVKALMEIGLIGAVGSGGPDSVYTAPPSFDREILKIGLPYFGICYSFQEWADDVGAKVEHGRSQYSVHKVQLMGSGSLLAQCPSEMPVLMSHGDEITALQSFDVHAYCDGVVAAGSKDHLHGALFHPECPETVYGDQIFDNFFFEICGGTERFPAEDVLKRKIQELVKLREAGIRIVLLLSGGCDSSIVAYLFKAAGFDRTNLRGVYIGGVDRADDKANVEKYFGNQPWIKVDYIDATDELITSFLGKTKMPEKRSAGFVPVYNHIGGVVAEAFSEGGKYEVRIAQGTLYTDIVESGGGYEGSGTRVVKRHHNTKNEFRSPRSGELFSEVLPLADQVKNTARDIGRELGMSHEQLFRHPFPGPGMALRVDGEVTREKVAIARKADEIWIEELRNEGLYDSVWQAGAPVLMPGHATKPEADQILKEELQRAGLDTIAPHAGASLLLAEHTYIKGDDPGSGPIVMLSRGDAKACDGTFSWEFLDGVQQRIVNEVPGIGAVCYRLTEEGDPATEPTILLWGVYSVNGLTASHAQLPWDFLERVAKRIRKEIPGIGTVVYRNSNKPGTTIEIG